jgi:Flp pilus assembly protein TadB
MGAQLLIATTKSAHTSVQWSTLAWIVGVVVVAAVVITIIVVLSRRPKSMEDGIEEFSRSLQAVAPSQRAGARPVSGQARPGSGNGQEERSVRTTRGEAEPV